MAQLDLFGSTRTGALSLDRLVTIPRITLSIRDKISPLEINSEDVSLDLDSDD